MSLLLGHSPKLFIRKPVLVRSSAGGSSPLVQTPPCVVTGADPCGAGHVLLEYGYTMKNGPFLIKKAPVELVYNDEAVTTIGSSHGWVASLTHGVGTLRLHDDLNPVASNANPKRILLPPLVTLPHCQTQIITNVSLSTLSPEDEDCVVAVKFMGPQLSYCRPSSARGNSKWFNIRIANPSFFSSPVMFSKKHNMFCIPAAGGQLIASWDLCKDEHTPKIQELLYHSIHKLSELQREVMDTCFTTEHLMESQSTGETILVKCFRQTVDGGTSLKTKAVMVFKVSPKGNAFCTHHLDDLAIFISKSEPFCVRASSFPGLDIEQLPNGFHSGNKTVEEEEDYDQQVVAVYENSCINNNPLLLLDDDLDLETMFECLSSDEFAVLFSSIY
ncbi:hypothetical protein HA466_0311040 [Hirschfeldia incana]|nr:hypothetical protein HA466_0311040 [Hirschfeldia incana]